MGEIINMYRLVMGKLKGKPPSETYMKMER
jgi:hypothetical protein